MPKFTIKLALTPFEKYINLSKDYRISQIKKYYYFFIQTYSKKQYNFFIYMR